MDVEELFMIINDAVQKLREIAVRYYGTPYTAVVVDALKYECERVVGGYNRILRECLNIELCPVISNVPTKTSISCRLIIKRCYNSYAKVGGDHNEIPQYN